LHINTVCVVYDCTTVRNINPPFYLCNVFCPSSLFVWYVMVCASIQYDEM